MITASAPTPPVIRFTPASISCSDNAASMPIFNAASTRLGSKSVPRTRQPFALSICTVNCPKKPSPITMIVSPSAGTVLRTPCKAIAPRATVDASSKLTVSGIGAVRLTGTHTYSAWCAACALAHATRSPMEKVSTPGPTSITVPANE